MRTCFLVFSLLASSVIAQPPGGFQPPPDYFVKAIDKNQDRKISKDELKQASISLLKFDSNKDGKLDEMELFPENFLPEGIGPENNSPFGRRPPSPIIMAIDKDRNREFSKAELADASKSLLTLDRNRDGELSAEELRPRFRRRGPGGMNKRLKIVEKFDKDKDKRLNDEERKLAREHVKKERSANGGPGRRRFPNSGGQDRPREPGKPLKSEDVKHYPDAKLYDTSIIRTFFLEFDTKDWEEEVADFYRTDVQVPAVLTVDGKSLGKIGVRFRGNSSFFTVAAGQKRSFNLSIDAFDNKKDLYGYNTLNLLNAHADPSMLREVLYSQIARNYIPAPKANFVRVVINGENWGIYVNAQQFNKDFLKEWFDTSKGVRWKVPAGFRGPKPLVYTGDKKESYQEAFQLKSKESPKAWEDLIKLCKAFQETKPAQAEEQLSSLLNIDRALWFLALDNVFIDSDGYISRGSDYAIYQDPIKGRFHLLPYDSNETFRYAGQGGPGARSTGTPGANLEPLTQIDQENRPVIRVLLSNPILRARYIAHMRTIVDEWLDWKKINPIVEKYHKLLEEDVKVDTRKLYSFEAFKSNVLRATSGGRRATPGLKQFVDERRKFLLNHELFKKPTPTIKSVNLSKSKREVQAIVGREVPVSQVLLWYNDSKFAPYRSIAMSKADKANESIYVAKLPTMPAGTTIRYYVEARAEEKLGTTTFFPARAEQSSLTHQIELPGNGQSAIVINELLANPMGEEVDWIELYNRSEQSVNLSGIYLSDDKDNLRKWKFPIGTTLKPNEYLIILADEKKDADGKLHANFKLSSKGETVYLSNSKQVLDSIEFGKQRTNVAFGRYPNGSQKLQGMVATPGKANQDHE